MISNLPLFPEEFRHYRNELKYVCTEGELTLLHARIGLLCQPDPHAGSDGIYRIRSLYFDDSENRYYYENENGDDPREKFRIRIYNASRDRITLECKRKERGMTAKESCPLSLREYEMLLEGKLLPNQTQAPLLKRLTLLQQQTDLKPKVIVAYERTPFVYPFGNVRITFDRNIGSSTDLAAFFDAELPLRPVLPVGKQVLEVKYDELLPDFLYSAMSLGSLQRTAFSKYYLCRRFTP